MEITVARDLDIPLIVGLLKKSLGEELTPKSEQYWNWKHVENPFGNSPVLLAWEDGDLIGVRAFMRWDWIENGRVYKSVRAVDTATHPKHQGKGIFKKLTLALVESCTRSHDDFVFNTPNGQSMPGYLKMGWEEAGKIPVKVMVIRPFNMAMQLVTRSQPARLQEDLNARATMDFLNHPDLSQLLDDYLQRQKAIATHVTVPYLKWRYQSVPVAKYVSVTKGTNSKLDGVMVGRIKPGSRGVEFRITDCFCRRDDMIKELIRKARSSYKFDFITAAGLSRQRSLSGWNTIGTKGPSVTIRTLGHSDLNSLRGFNNWAPSLGDLELF